LPMVLADSARAFRRLGVEKHWSRGLGPGPYEVGQKGLKLLHLWCHLQKT